MKERLRVSVVSYLNSTPFIEGMIRSGFDRQIDLSLDIPAVCAAKLLNGTVDIGLIPVAVIPLLREYHILTGFCIGADGPVRSVCLYSDVPLEDIRTIILDNQSRTSVTLVKILCEKLWKITPEYTLGKDGYIDQIGGATAGVVIGDRTFALENRFSHVYDLSVAWKSLTGLPFVFACWVSNKPVDADTEKTFNDALELGMGLRGEIAIRYADRFPPDSGLLGYLTDNISYRLDESKRAGLKCFLDLLS